VGAAAVGAAAAAVPEEPEPVPEPAEPPAGALVPQVPTGAFKGKFREESGVT